MEDIIGKILSDSKTIAVVGLSDKPDRASNSVSGFMQTKGYRIIPVNPTIREALGEKAYASLSEIPEKIDMVNVFRRSEEVLPIAEEAVKIGAKFFWMQEGVHNNQAREILEAAGIPCVIDRCVMKEFLKRDPENDTKGEYGMAGNILELTAANFKETVNGQLPVLVDFWAPWCGPCRAIAPILEEVAKEFEGKALICKVNVDNNPDIASQFGVRGIPTLILFKGGQIKEQKTGMNAKSNIVSLLQKNI